MKPTSKSSKGIVKTNSKKDQRTAVGMLFKTKATYLTLVGKVESLALTLTALIFEALFSVTAKTLNLYSSCGLPNCLAG